MEMDINLIPELINALRDRIGVLELEKIIAETHIKQLQKQIIELQETVELKEEIIEQTYNDKNVNIKSDGKLEEIKKYTPSSSRIEELENKMKNPELSNQGTDVIP